MTGRVIDASVGIKWFVPEPGTSDAGRVRAGNEPLHVPAFFDLEVANIVWKKVRRGDIDASVAVKVFLPEPLAAEANALIGLRTSIPPGVFHVPDLFDANCANIFWKQVQRGNTTAARVQADLALLHTWQLTPTPTYDLILDALAIALNYAISAYDACYVALASRLGIPLITADQKLLAKLAGTPLAPIWLGAWTPPVP